MKKQIVKIAPKVGWREIDSKIVVFSCENQNMVIWNETASFLWKTITSKQVTMEFLEDCLVSEYSISYAQAKNGVNEYINEAISLGFILNKAGKINKKRYTKLKGEEEGENILLAIEMEAIRKTIPFAATFEVTYSCNEDCIHCYMDRSLPALSCVEIKRILDELASSGCLFVSFTGGEIFCRTDAFEIIQYASDLNFVIDILSNATLITKNNAEWLAKRNIRRVQVSLYGSKKETHDMVSRHRGSFRKTVSAIQFLVEAGIKVEIAFPMMNVNFHERHEVKALSKELGCLLSPSPIITARNNGKTDTFDLRLSDQQLFEFLNDIELSATYTGRKPFHDHQLYLGLSDLSEAAPCYSGFNTCAITPSGKVLPCNQLMYEVGDLREKSFKEIWRNSSELKHLRGVTIKDLVVCSKCKMLSSCARCPGLAMLEGGDLLGPSFENCRLCQIKKEVK